MEPFNDESLRKWYRQAVIISLAMVFSVVVYAVVVEFIIRSNSPFTGYSPLPADVFSKLRLAMFAATPVIFVLIPFLRKRILSPGSRTGISSGANMPEYVGKLFTALVISFALCETIAIFGLLLFLMNGARQEFYIFFIMSFTAFVIHFPRFERWQEWVRNMEGILG